MRAANPGGGQLLRPPISRESSEAILQREINDDSWRFVCKAFNKYGFRKRNLETSKASRKKDDKEGWHYRRNKVMNAINSAINQVAIARTANGNFLSEVSENYSLKANEGRSYLSDESVEALLMAAREKLYDAFRIVNGAEPQSREVATDAETRCMLARDLKCALIPEGEKGFLSDRRALPANPAETDLTPFEQLLSALEVHIAETPEAFSLWLSRALEGQN